jgi:hypothetical protein
MSFVIFTVYLAGILVTCNVQEERLKKLHAIAIRVVDLEQCYSNFAVHDPKSYITMAL